MPKYTTYKSIYENVSANDEARSHRLFSIPSFLHSAEAFKLHFNKSRAIKTSLLIVVIALFAGTGVVHALQNNATISEVRTVVVSPGDTLWSIAVEHKPEDADTRVFISGIKQKNGLTQSEIHAGDQLILPNF